MDEVSAGPARHTAPVAPELLAAAQQLIAAAKYTKDAEDPVAFAAVWARAAHLTIDSNGRLLGPLVGRDEILAFYSRNWSTGAHGAGERREVHVAEAPFVTALEGGRLLALHCAIFAAMHADEPQLIGFGQFRDELAEEDGSWRIVTRHSTIRRRSRPAE